MKPDPNTGLIAMTLAGDRKAARELLSGLQGRVYNLALRFLGDPESAMDACQEICLKVWNSLPTFRGESLFSTWALRIAANYLLSSRRSRLEDAGISFEAYEAEAGSVPSPRSCAESLETRTLAEELRFSCSLGMLQCLDRTDRLVYVLYAFFRVTGDVGSQITGLSPDAWRQRLSRVRRKMADFMKAVCGVADETAPCHCQDRVMHALREGRINPERLYFSNPEMREPVSELTRTMEDLDADTGVFRSHPAFRHPAGAEAVRAILESTAPGFLLN